MIEKEYKKKIMYHDYFSNFARRNCAFFSDAVPVYRVVRAVEFKMATGANSGYIVMLRARMFRSLIPVLMIKERNIRARNITI